MDYKKEIQNLLDLLKELKIERDEVERGIGAGENYIDQVLARGGNKLAYNKIKLFADFKLLNAIPQTQRTAKDASIRKPKTESSPFLIPFISRKAQAGYVKSYDQIEYMDTLEKYSLPPGVDPRGAEWLYFEVEGDSMEPAFLSGDIILASMVPAVDWDEIRNFYVYVIVTEDRLLIKRIFRKGKDKWVLISDNEDNYGQEFITVKDIRQLWVYRKTWHTNAKPPKKFEIKI